MANEKTWEFAVNEAATQTTAAILTKWELWWMVQVLLGRVGGVTTGAWTVVSSSDGSSRSASDLWGASFVDTKFVRAASGVAHSWFCLSRANFGGVSGRTVYLVFDCINSSDNSLFQMRWSQIAPSAGTIQVAPVASDSVLLACSDQWNTGSNAVQHYMHAMVTTTGDFCFYETSIGTGHFYAMCGLLGLMDTRDTDDYGVVGLHWGSGTSRMTYPGIAAQSWSSVNSANIYSAMQKHDGSGQMRAAAMGMVMGANAGGSAVARPFSLEADIDSVDELYADLPVYIFSTDNAGYNSIRGRLPDIRWAPESLPLDSVTPPIAGGVTNYEACGAASGIWLPWTAAVTPNL